MSLPSAGIRTEDIDIALDYGIARNIPDRTDDLLRTLKAVDPSFSPRANLSNPNLVAKLANEEGYLVEFLTTHRGSDENTGRISRLPAFGRYIGGVPLRHLDFLIRCPVRSIILYQTGVTVTIPDPSRYAVHKMIVAACRREDNPKIPKDLAQASELITALQITNGLEKLGDVWNEALQRGEKWRSKLWLSVEKLDPECARILRAYG